MKTASLVISLASAFTIILTSPGNAQFTDPKVEKLRQDIAKASSCITDSDCISIDANKCPYGCRIPINRKYEKQLSKALGQASDTCQLTCPPKSYYETRKLSCQNRFCEWVDPKRVKKASPAQLKAIADGQSVLDRIAMLRDVVRKYVGHGRRLEIKLKPIEQRMRSGEAPKKSDYQTLTQLEQRYGVLGSAAKKK